MKKNYISLFVAFVVMTGFLLSSCEDCIEGNGKLTSKTIKVGDVKQIKLSGDANVVLTTDSSASGSIKIEGESNIIDVFQFDESGKSLKIKTEPCIRNHETVTITIPVKMIEMLTINGSGNFSSKSKLKASDLELVVNGSGNIELQVDAGNVSNQINGSGSIILKGTAQSHKTVINGSGNLEASDFATGAVHITINGSGDCKVLATTALSVKVRGSGNVYYKGSPNISTEVKGSGSVEKLD